MTDTVRHDAQTIVWTFALFWYQLYNSFDGTYLFDYSYILFYNVAFTSLPIILMGTLDQDVSDRVSLAVPQLYRRGIERKEWTQTKFWSVFPSLPLATLLRAMSR